MEACQFFKGKKLDYEIKKPSFWSIGNPLLEMNGTDKKRENIFSSLKLALSPMATNNQATISLLVPVFCYLTIF